MSRSRRPASYGRRRHLVAYDIADDGRRTRVFNTMKAHGRWLQYSIFVCDLSATELIRLRWELEELVDFGLDRVMIIDLGKPDGRGTDCFEFIGRAPELPSGGAHIV